MCFAAGKEDKVLSPSASLSSLPTLSLSSPFSLLSLPSLSFPGPPSLSPLSPLFQTAKEECHVCTYVCVHVRVDLT